jgi:hypothetical protein
MQDVLLEDGDMALSFGLTRARPVCVQTGRARSEGARGAEPVESWEPMLPRAARAQAARGQA